MGRRQQASFWIQVIRAVNTPLSYYVLSLSIVETTLGVVITKADLDPLLRWVLCLAMIAFMAANFAVVAALSFRNPKNLLFGKDEHFAPQMDSAALKDQIEEIIVQRVKCESLK